MQGPSFLYCPITVLAKGEKGLLKHLADEVFRWHNPHLIRMNKQTKKDEIIHSKILTYCFRKPTVIYRTALLTLFSHSLPDAKVWAQFLIASLTVSLEELKWPEEEKQQSFEFKI